MATPAPPEAPPVSKGRQGHQLPTRVSDAFWKLLQVVAKKERRYVAPTVQILLEEALRARGYELPPAEEAE